MGAIHRQIWIVRNQMLIQNTFKKVNGVIIVDYIPIHLRKDIVYYYYQFFFYDKVVFNSKCCLVVPVIKHIPISVYQYLLVLCII